MFMENLIQIPAMDGYCLCLEEILLNKYGVYYSTNILDFFVFRLNLS
jgi:hypothetical protein